MPINPSIALQLNPLPDPNAPMKGAYELAAWRQRIATGQAEAEQRQRALAEQTAVDTAWTKASGNQDEFEKYLGQNNMGHLVLPLRKAWQEGVEGKLRIAKTTQDIATGTQNLADKQREQEAHTQSQIAHLGNGYVQANGDPVVGLSLLDHAVLPEETKAQYRDLIRKRDPNFFQQMKSLADSNPEIQKLRAEQAQSKAQLASTEQTTEKSALATQQNTLRMTGNVLRMKAAQGDNGAAYRDYRDSIKDPAIKQYLTDSLGDHPTPDQVRDATTTVTEEALMASRERSAAQRDVSINIADRRADIAERHESLWEEAQKRSMSATAGLTPEALDYATMQAITTGKFSVGRGKNAEAVNIAILNNVPRLAANMPPAQRQATYNSLVGSRKNIQKISDSIDAFSNAAVSNLNLSLGLIQKIQDSGIPILNQPLRKAAHSLQGSPYQAAFNAARIGDINELSRAITTANGTGVISDTARNELQEMLPKDATVKEYVAAATTLRKMVDNRRASNLNELATIDNSINLLTQIPGAGSAAAPGAALGVAAPAVGGTPTQPGGTPDDPLGVKHLLKMK